jgi:hypothetical protein
VLCCGPLRGGLQAQLAVARVAEQPPASTPVSLSDGTSSSAAALRDAQRMHTHRRWPRPQHLSRSPLPVSSPTGCPSQCSRWDGGLRTTSKGGRFGSGQRPENWPLYVRTPHRGALTALRWITRSSPIRHSGRRTVRAQLRRQRPRRVDRAGDGRHRDAIDALDPPSPAAHRVGNSQDHTWGIPVLDRHGPRREQGGLPRRQKR